ncbi:hypothetical protein LBMAG27_10980 [Bacteroidota bacterium]|nr:hypothetical protein LBMAG27_10980 [Bacteroidota bacterium]
MLLNSNAQSLFISVPDSANHKIITAKKILPKKLLSIAPFSLFNKIKFQYERVLKNEISVGVGGYFTYKQWDNGFAVNKVGGANAFLRWYPLGKAPTGIYFQPKFTMHYCSKSVEYSLMQNDSFGYQHAIDSKMVEHKFGIYVGSIDLGGQWLIANRVPIDISIGLKAAVAEKYSFKPEETIHGTVYKQPYAYYNTDLYSVGMPGFPIGMNFNVGIAF